MFTQNYINLKKLQFFYTGTGAYEYFVDSTGTKVYGYNNILAGSDIGGWTSNVIREENPTMCGTSFGTGTTPPTLDDYKMESVITSGFTVLSSALIQSQEDGKYIHDRVYSLKNNTENDMTISEIGLFSRVLNGSSTSAGYKYVLMFRTVLDNPVTIPPGVAKVVTLRMTFNQSQ